MQITAIVETCTGHRLIGYQGKCSHPHGHNYLWTCTLSGQHDPFSHDGILIDFAILKRTLKSVVDRFDHAMVLNETDIMVGWLREQGNKFVTINCNPTAENLGSLVAAIMNRLFPQYVITIEVKETRDSSVNCGPIYNISIIEDAHDFSNS